MAANAEELMAAFTAGLDIDAAGFKAHQEKVKAETDQADKDAFKEKIAECMNKEELPELIKAVKAVIMEAAKAKGMNSEVSDEDKAILKTNLANHFSQPGMNPCSEDYSGPAIQEVMKAMVGSFMALGFKASSATN